MAQVLVTESYLDDIADAIREKNGSEDTYTPAQMAGAIGDIHTADEVVLVSKSISANGTYNPASDSADGYSGVSVNVPNTYTESDEGKVVSSGNLVSQSSKSITQNGTHDTTMNNSVSVDVPNSYSASDNGKVVVNQSLTAQTSKSINTNGTHDTTANNIVVVDVPNSYAAADEGKVVSGGALVGQTSRNVTMNGTYDTTENNEVVVNVQGGSGESGIHSGSISPSASLGNNGDFYVQQKTFGIISSDGGCYFDTGVKPNGMYKLESEFALNFLGDGYDTIFGCRNGNNARFTLRYPNNNTNGIAFQKSKTPTTSYSTHNFALYKTISLNAFNRITCNQIQKVNGKLDGNAILTSNDVSQFPYNIYFLANNNAGSPGDYAYADAKYLKIWNENDVLIRCFVAVLDNNNIPCLYDMMTDSYLYNLGNGTLTYDGSNLQTMQIIWRKNNGEWEIINEKII